MARIKTSGLIDNITGSVGGTTFQQSRAGLIMKNKPKGFHANTVRRNKQTNIMNSLQHSWMGLTDSNRSYWNQFALYKKIPQTNNPHLFINGHEVYLKYNFYRLLTGRTVQNSCLWGFSTIDPLDITLWIPGPGLTITGSRNFNPPVEFMILYISYPCPPSIENPGSRLKFINFTYGAGASKVITNDYIAVHGRVPVIGETVFMKFRMIDLIGLYVLPWQYQKVKLA